MMMMTRKRSRSETAVRNAAAACGATVVEVGTTGSSHRFALIEFRGRRRSFFFGNSASDWRASRNATASVRRWIKGCDG
jgi:hypothetical protein